MIDFFELKIINLLHRKDRKIDCMKELQTINIVDLDNVFFNAKFVSDYGALGCALSHAMAMAEFLFESEKQYLIILEDDFNIEDPQIFLEKIRQIILIENKWDCFLLGHNVAIPIEQTEIQNVFRVINAQTTSGYLVNRSYIPKMIQYFFKSAELLRKYKGLPSPNKEISKHFFSCDILWKNIQIDDIFLASFPPMITQRKSYSDIDKNIVDYGV